MDVTTDLLPAERVGQMPTLRDVFIMPDVPASELPTIREETLREGIFTLTESDNGDGTFDLT
ncbi:MAG TPA: hypothetical protein VJT13_15040, partial [Xanthobacteraceae bacterium]|nr:hypothetical protein [Xanthobacteraceae bacterium]